MPDVPSSGQKAVIRILALAGVVSLVFIGISTPTQAAAELAYGRVALFGAAVGALSLLRPYGVGVLPSLGAGIVALILSAAAGFTMNQYGVGTMLAAVSFVSSFIVGMRIRSRSRPERLR